jgi:hypothetical protein
MMQPNLFGGATYDPARDEDRLRAQLYRVFTVMRTGHWLTLNAIAALTDDPPASVSARLRDFRKEKFGGHTVERRYLQRGLFEYRLVLR